MLINSIISHIHSSAINLSIVVVILFLESSKMKSVAFLSVALIGLGLLISTTSAYAPTDEQFNSVIDALKLTLGGHLKNHVKAALERSQGLQVQVPDVDIVPRNLDGPALPSQVHINITLNDIYHHGIGDIVPDIDVDLLRLSLRANYKLPEFRLQGGYSIQILSNFKPEETGSREWLVLNGESASEASVRFSQLELEIEAKLKWTLFGGFKVQTLDYTLAPFGLDVSFPNLHVMEGLLDATRIINPVLTRILHKELWDMELDYHEPLVTAIRDFVDWLLAGGLIG